MVSLISVEVDHVNVAAVILAAGESKRFGTNKMLYRINGVPIIKLSLRAYAELERAVIVGRDADLILKEIGEEVVIYNPKFKEGISESLKLGIRFFQDYDGVIVGLGDMPLVTRETVEKVLNSFKPECAAVIPTHSGTRGNPVLISKRIFKQVLGLKGDVGASMVLRKREDICEVEAGEEVLIDVDTPADLSLFSRRLA